MPQKLTKRQKRQRMQLEASLTSDAGCVMSTLAPKSHLTGMIFTAFPSFLETEFCPEISIIN